jgi:transcriptional regulator with XRE-family HTH domain
MDHRAELAEFLRARRDAVTPEQVGLPRGGGHRRTPGLRREEVAMLAGVSITWYTWLEQGRRINASPDVLTAIGRALRLDDAGIEHLHALAQPSPSPIPAPQEAPSALVRLIDSMEPAPAYVLGPHWEFRRGTAPRSASTRGSSSSTGSNATCCGCCSAIRTRGT